MHLNIGSAKMKTALHMPLAVRQQPSTEFTGAFFNAFTLLTHRLKKWPSHESSLVGSNGRRTH